MTRYLAALDVMALNDEIVRRMDGTDSLLRDEGALEGALARPQMAAHYESADLVAQAAILIAGVALAYAFVDGNKRTALAAGDTFLTLNGQRLAFISDADGLDLGQRIEKLVVNSKRLAEETAELAEWLRKRVVAEH